MTRACDECGKEYTYQRSTSKFCSADCRVRANGGAPKIVKVEPSRSGNAVRVATEQLEAAGRLDTPAAAAALALGALLDAGVQSGAAAIAREYREAMASALDGAKSAVHPMDELLARRERRRA